LTEERERIYEALTNSLRQLSEPQLEYIAEQVEQLQKPYVRQFRLPESDLIDDCVYTALGDHIRIHHVLSRHSFTKDPFEHALTRSLNRCGHTASLAPPGNPGYDVIADGHRLSLKTQADKGIRPDYIWISKFMELGKGEWSDNPSDLEGLRQQFLAHLQHYDRIFTLRCLSKGRPNWHYELVEIPKSLLLEASNGRLEMMLDSTQMPKPGYCYVTDGDGNQKFQLYFDGGGERKLQVKYLRKSYCILHAEWVFPG